MTDAEIEAIVTKLVNEAIEAGQGTPDPIELRKRIEEAIFLARREENYRIQAALAHERVREANLPVHD